jgi:hypothetical protein
MLQVSDVWADARSIFGKCAEEQTYQWLSDAIDLLVTKGEWDPTRAYVDLCCPGQEVSLPSEVETPLAVLIDGQPSLAHDELFQFHLNGPGDNWHPCNYSWINQGTWPTFQDLPGPRRLWATSTSEADVGLSMTIYGEDSSGATLCESEPSQDGMLIPIQHGPAALSIPVNRITRIVKPRTAGRIKIFAVDYSNARCNPTGTLVADMQYWETTPQYRRIRLARPARAVRMLFRRRTFRVSKQTDLIPLHHRLALVVAMQAVKSYRDNRYDEGLTAEAQAVRWLNEKEATLIPPGGIPIQVNVAGGLTDGEDYGND